MSPLVFLWGPWVYVVWVVTRRGLGVFGKHVQSRNPKHSLRITKMLRLVSTHSPILRSRLGTRNIHKRIPLPYSINDGLGKFLPPAALQTLVDYQDGLLSRLNEEVRGSSLEIYNHWHLKTFLRFYSWQQAGEPRKCHTYRYKICEPAKEDISIQLCRASAQ